MKPLDPVDLTRRLVDISSLTYDEAAVGEYLDGLLQERGFTVERTPVPQPRIAATLAPLQPVCRRWSAARRGAFHAHGYGAPLYSQQRG